jgi:cytochrome c556
VARALVRGTGRASAQRSREPDCRGSFSLHGSQPGTDGRTAGNLTQRAADAIEEAWAVRGSQRIGARRHSQEAPIAHQHWGDPAAAPASDSTSQGPNAPPPNVAKQAIDNRKAVFTLIGSNFKPIGEILRGTPYELVDVNKFASRVAFLAGLLPEAFPDISRTGDTRATPEVWSNRADFNKRLKDFGDHAVALSRLVQGGGELDAFRNAARTVAQDCKGCHDTYRTK